MGQLSNRRKETRTVAYAFNPAPERQIPSNRSSTPTFSLIENLEDPWHRKACVHTLASHIEAFETIVSTIQRLLIKMMEVDYVPKSLLLLAVLFLANNDQFGR